MSRIAVVVALVCIACGDGDRSLDDGEPCAAPTRRCDITDLSCAEVLLELTACVRGDDTPPLPDIAYRTAEEAVASLREDVEDAAAVDAPWDAAFRALGLLADGQTSLDASIAQFVTSVTAYYEPETKGVTIITDARGSASEVTRMYVLSHELTHYLQDRAADVLQLQAAAGGSTDRRTSLHALLEGDAVVSSTRVLIRLLGRSIDDFLWGSYFASLEEETVADLLFSEAPLVDALQFLPYLVGGRYIGELWERDGRGPVDALYDDVPEALADWIDRDGEPAQDSATEPLECAPPLAPPGFTLYAIDSFGAAGAYALLAAAKQLSLSLPARLRSDRIAVYLNEGEPNTAVIVVWRMRFASEEAAVRFAELATDRERFETHRNGVELTIRASSERDERALRGDALMACPAPEALQPAGALPMPHASRFHRAPLWAQ